MTFMLFLGMANAYGEKFKSFHVNVSSTASNISVMRTNMSIAIVSMVRTSDEFIVPIVNLI